MIVNLLICTVIKEDVLGVVLSLIDEEQLGNFSVEVVGLPVLVVI